MCDQLDVFLQQETKGFVDKLFVTLETKSYLQSNPEPPGAIQAEAPNVPIAAAAAVIPAAEEVNNKSTTDIVVKLERDSRTSSTKSSSKPVDRTKRRSWSPRFVLLSK